MSLFKRPLLTQLIHLHITFEIKMTIKGLWNYIAKNCPHICEEIPQSNLTGHRIAIDAGTWLYPIRAIASKDVIQRTDVLRYEPDNGEIDRIWMTKVLIYLLDMLERGITPVLCFDGKSPSAKNATSIKRDDDRRVRQEKLNLIRSKGDLLFTAVDLVEARKLMYNLSYVPRESSRNMREFLYGIGVPCLQGSDGVEAERVASVMVTLGIAAACYSADSDCFAHKSHILIRGKGKDLYNSSGFQVPSFNIVRLNRLLAHLELKFSQFVDLCIMAGCDYNANMKGISFCKSLPLIRTHMSLEYLPSKYDTTCLNIETCRDMFKHEELCDLIDEYDSVTFDFQVDIEECCSETLRMFCINDYSERMTRLQRGYITPSDYHHPNVDPVCENGIILIVI